MYGLSFGVGQPLSHGLRNEVAPWRESAPQPLSFTPREKAVVDQTFLLNVGTRCVMRFRDADGPN